MSKVRKGGEPVRKFLIENIGTNPTDIVRLTTEKFGCTRQAVHKHLRRLVTEGAVKVTGKTRTKRYELAPLENWSRNYSLGQRQAEDIVWSTDILPRLGKLPENVLHIWNYTFTEMFNNVIDHSGASFASVTVNKTAASTSIEIYDDGVGIFKKIQAALGLAEEQHSVLELAKGKFTTDPSRHSGEGIFFSSRMCDEFYILSGKVYFSHEFDKEGDWIVPRSDRGIGTLVRMVLHNHTARTMKKVFDKFTSDEDYGFTKTIVPVKMLQFGGANLVSRSQAHRLLARIDKFKVVMLDFSGVPSVGQAFADEVFRVFKSKHPEIELVAIHASSEIRRMISRAQVLAESNLRDAMDVKNGS